MPTLLRDNLIFLGVAWILVGAFLGFALLVIGHLVDGARGRRW